MNLKNLIRLLKIKRDKDKINIVNGFIRKGESYHLKFGNIKNENKLSYKYDKLIKKLEEKEKNGYKYIKGTINIILPNILIFYKKEKDN